MLRFRLLAWSKEIGSSALVTLSCPAQFSAESTTLVSHAIRPAEQRAINESQRLEMIRRRTPLTRLSATLSGFACVFRQMPGVAPLANISFKLRRVGDGDLMCRCGERFAFGCVLPFPADRALGFIVH